MVYLPYFINEDVYLIGEDKTSEPGPSPEEKVKPEKQVSPHEEAPLSYEGKNLKKILVLTVSEEADFLTVRERVFLGNILQALELNFDDIAIVNITKINGDTVDKINHFDCRCIISFGVTNEQMFINSNTPFYEKMDQGKITFLLADPLLIIEGDQQRKRKLWNALKHLFSE